MGIAIRREGPGDQRTVEVLTREAFWNVHQPGCDEHFLVHEMRSHPDFIPELDYVIEEEGEIRGNIMYTRAKLIGGEGMAMDIATFGPLSIHPMHQRRGLGRRLMEFTAGKAAELGFPAIVIYGNPANYVGVGFKSAHRYGISAADGSFPSAMLALELEGGALGRGPWRYAESPAYDIDAGRAELFDRTFETKQKGYAPSQEEFYILSKSRIVA